jgi:hypothetical protein
VLLAGAVLSGFLAGALEGDMFRAVRFAGAISDAAMSFTSFWAIAAIFAASWTVRALGRPRPGVVRFALLGVLLAHLATWRWLPEIRGWFNEWYAGAMAGRAASHPEVDLRTLVVYPFQGSLLVMLGFAGAVVFPAYYLASLLLPTLCNALQGDRRHLGPAYGANTIAFCAGAVLFTWVAPAVSLFYSVKLLFVVLAAGAGLALTFRRERRLSSAAVGWLASIAS